MAAFSASSSSPWSRGPAFRLGESLLLLEEDRAAAVDPVRQANGWRYITLQIADIDAVHDGLGSKGVREGFAPVTLRDVVDIDDPRSGRELDRIVPPRLDRRRSQLSDNEPVNKGVFTEHCDLIRSEAIRCGPASGIDI